MRFGPNSARSLSVGALKCSEVCLQFLMPDSEALLLVPPDLVSTVCRPDSAGCNRYKIDRRARYKSNGFVQTNQAPCCNLLNPHKHSRSPQAHMPGRSDRLIARSNPFFLRAISTPTRNP